MNNYSFLHICKVKVYKRKSQICRMEPIGVDKNGREIYHLGDGVNGVVVGYTLAGTPVVGAGASYQLIREYNERRRPEDPLAHETKYGILSDAPCCGMRDYKQ